MKKRFDSIYSHGIIRVAAAVPRVGLADPAFNAERTIALMNRASELRCALAVFPELGLSAYSNEDLFHQDAMLDASLQALSAVVDASHEATPVVVVGAPLRFNAMLFNCAVVIYRGNVLGIIPKSYLPNYREFYEKRQFTSARQATVRDVTLFGKQVPFGNDLIFKAKGIKGFTLHAEICEDVWTPIPPSSIAALSGATVLCNLSASNITVGKADYRKDLCRMQSAKCIAGYIYTAAGYGESTTDLAWDGHAMVCENGALLGESHRFADDEQLLTSDLDVERLLLERMRTTSFADCAADHNDRTGSVRRIEFPFEVPGGPIPLQREIAQLPFVPSDPVRRDERCYEVYNIQVQGLMQRLQASGTQRIVIGVSGGLDSTHALIVAAKAMDRLNLPRTNILAYTMPGFATSDRTYNDACALMNALGVTASEIDIKPSCMQMLADIGHPFANGEPVYDITFENVQAGERTSHLFRLANLHGGIVLGTGDLSELALGWCTYGVGDQMSHYNVNASVPKTLIRYLIRWAVATHQYDDSTSETLRSIAETVISPELIPDSDGTNETPTQDTQDVIGPYELQDFNLYYITRFGFRPGKVVFLSEHAWDGEYDRTTIVHWMEVFLKRFFQFSQFKRSAMPNGPKVGSGGSLSPRGDWRAPSDAPATVWLDELRSWNL